MVKPFFSTYINCCECRVAFNSQRVFKLKKLMELLSQLKLFGSFGCSVVKVLCTYETHTQAQTQLHNIQTHIHSMQACTPMLVWFHF